VFEIPSDERSLYEHTRNPKRGGWFVTRSRKLARVRPNAERACNATLRSDRDLADRYGRARDDFNLSEQPICARGSKVGRPRNSSRELLWRWQMLSCCARARDKHLVHTRLTSGEYVHQPVDAGRARAGDDQASDRASNLIVVRVLSVNFEQNRARVRSDTPERASNLLDDISPDDDGELVAQRVQRNRPNEMHMPRVVPVVGAKHGRELAQLRIRWAASAVEELLEALAQGGALRAKSLRQSSKQITHAVLACPHRYVRAAIFELRRRRKNSFYHVDRGGTKRDVDGNKSQVARCGRRDRFARSRVRVTDHVVPVGDRERQPVDDERADAVREVAVSNASPDDCG
jgi:hypothetical protein